MSNGQHSSGVWSLLAEWTFVSSIGWAAGLAAGISLSLAATELSWLDEDRFFAYATLTSLGLTTGAAQWVVMRRYLPRPVRWVAATLTGYLLCLIIGMGGTIAGLGRTGVWDDVLLLVLFGTAIRRVHRQAAPAGIRPALAP